MKHVTVIGGGIAGLVAAIELAEAGADVQLLEARAQLGGRGRSTDGSWRTNFGPHVFYRDGPMWTWMAERKILAPYSRPPLTAPIEFRVNGNARRVPPVKLTRALLRRTLQAPTDRDLRAWATDEFDPETAALLSHAAGVFSFTADPGALSAAFVWERLVRVTKLPPAARYVHGGWSAIADALADHAARAGVQIATNRRVSELPPGPVVVATELADARELLGDARLEWPGARCVCLSLGVVARRGDPFVLSDLDASGWVERFSAPDPSLAPKGHSLIEAQTGIRDGESTEAATARLEALVDAGYRGWREREVWRRRIVLESRSGALDPPGTSWRDRPAVDRGDGVFLAGDMVAAPGLLSEVAFNSAREAARGALEWSRTQVGATTA